MNANSYAGISDWDAFVFFKDLYHKETNFHCDCESAFQSAIQLFMRKYGYVPYRHLEDYLNELFEKMNGFQLFDKNLKP